MVTFTSDYWAPALDVHVSRRMSTDKGLLHLGESPFDILPSDFASTSTLSSSSSHSWEFAKVSKHHSFSSKKLKKLVKLFNHDSRSSRTSQSPPESPIEDVDSTPPLSSATTPPDRKLLPKIGRRMSLKKAETSGPLFKLEDSLLKKYGVCDKGCIGKGATAVVRLAHKLDAASSEEKLYAIKEFRKRRKTESEKDYIKKLTSEFCISSTLHHTNVVETVDLVQDDHQNYCTVMEYCPGGDLYNIIKSGHMSTVEIDCCFKQLILGVAYLHSMGVAHRGCLKITDFGVSDVFHMCWENKSHMSKGLCGSEPYIAPEEFEEKEYDAPSVDIWSCGIVYYCMTFQG
ncbi:kinase-like domain-containing protein [Jimgerdemannia flammicorona]|uniref:non-specific serine/threonine protein kinase n=1 Tax=Jimgerdemannia flammicorona TaxID=994334 RepID=A0A433DCW8_9FUNG|nr:kinase-like domain-containing protein [Jimgerdemannia flammicorona]